MSDISVPVLVVGGGGCGLTTSILLSEHGIDHHLVERHTDTSPLPKAHYRNQRTMEVLRQ
ncbi:FAD-dependent monooxygenase, partial [Rhodococcus chondri]